MPITRRERPREQPFGGEQGGDRPGFKHTESELSAFVPGTSLTVAPGLDTAPETRMQIPGGRVCRHPGSTNTDGPNQGTVNARRMEGEREGKK